VPPPDLTIEVDDPGRRVSLSGRLCARTAADVRSALVAAIDSGSGDLVVDMDQVQLVDASGLGVLVGAHRLAMRSERRLVLRAVPASIERLLSITHLNRVLAVERPVASEASR
jgi:anti-anti-sigma factor